MRVLIACEYSGIVREAFRARGHDAMSCDLLPTEVPGPHYQRSVLEILDEGWDMIIAHPPCTHLAVSGARWWAGKQEQQREAIDFVLRIMRAKCPRIAVENPIGILSTVIGKPDQIVQPYWFGDPHTKSTCLWLKGLPLLKPTNMVSKGERHITKSGRSLPAWYNLPPSADRGKIRSKTFPGFAAAMAEQWG